MKTKFIILILVTTILFSFVFTACDVVTVPRETVNTESMFVIVEDAACWVVVYHKLTKVMYVRAVESGTFTMLVNSDGTPQLWNGE